MFCTRWFLPLLILPLPITPSYILVLYIISTALHAQACFNCIIVLTALFLSSCYWQPVPINSALYSPWSENITTFSQALDSMLPPNITVDKPPVVQFIDRCWCDITSSVFFQPFNVTKWEHDSLELYVDDAIRKQKKLENKHENGTSAGGQPGTPLEATAPQLSEWTPNTGLLLRKLRSLFNRTSPRRVDEPRLELHIPNLSSTLSSSDLPQPEKSDSKSNQSQEGQDSQTLSNASSLHWYQREYNLQPYGFDVIIEFGWDRTDR